MKLNFVKMNATNKANLNAAIKAKFNIEENTNNAWRGYNRNYTITMNYWGHVYNVMTIGGGWAVLEYKDNYNNGFTMTVKNITETTIDVIDVETWKNGAVNNTRRLTSDTLLKKYDCIAYMVYALVNCGYIDLDKAA